ncbi:hypothetical protein [Candidatus Entotheonella palauensis]|uniref:hypothetical protein n=1 Tax=Candidatus Entotheonella palauensis TaxID=93172 RepID=UPI000B7D7E33|nr:hypothetical protein [Candidatus Entotheonella palauensis]
MKTRRELLKSLATLPLLVARPAESNPMIWAALRYGLKTLGSATLGYVADLVVARTAEAIMGSRDGDHIARVWGPQGHGDQNHYGTCSTCQRAVSYMAAQMQQTRRPASRCQTPVGWCPVHPQTRAGDYCECVNTWGVYGGQAQ